MSSDFIGLAFQEQTSKTVQECPLSVTEKMENDIRSSIRKYQKIAQMNKQKNQKQPSQQQQFLDHYLLEDDYLTKHISKTKLDEVNSVPKSLKKLVYNRHHDILRQNVVEAEEESEKILKKMKIEFVSTNKKYITPVCITNDLENLRYVQEQQYDHLQINQMRYNSQKSDLLSQKPKRKYEKKNYIQSQNQQILKSNSYQQDKSTNIITSNNDSKDLKQQ